MRNFALEYVAALLDVELLRKKLDELYDEQREALADPLQCFGLLADLEARIGLDVKVARQVLAEWHSETPQRFGGWQVGDTGETRDGHSYRVTLIDSDGYISVEINFAKSAPSTLAASIRQAIVEQLDGNDISTFTSEQQFIDYWNTAMHYDAQDSDVNDKDDEDLVRQVYRELASESNSQPMAITDIRAVVAHPNGKVGSQGIYDLMAPVVRLESLE